jgi:hypothetical protein
MKRLKVRVSRRRGLADPDVLVRAITDYRAQQARMVMRDLNPAEGES